MTILLPLLSIFGITSIFSHIFKVRFTFSLPIVTSILVAVLFLCSILGILYYSAGVIILIGIIAQVYSLYAFPNLRKSILLYKIELISLAAIVIAYAIFLQSRYLYVWDDLAFWSVFTKELISYHDIYPKDALSSVLPSHVHYPRGPSLFHYFMLYFSGCSESLLLTAHFILQLLFLAPIMACRYFWQTILLISLLLIFPIMESFVLRSLYNDGMIAFIFSSVLIIFILEENKHKALFLVAPILLLMPLFREIGVVLAWCAVVMIFCSFLVDNNQKFKTYRSRICLLLGLLLLPFITYHLWFFYVETHTIMGRKNHNIEQTKEIILSLLHKDGENIQIVLLYINVVAKALTSKAFLFIYSILTVAWYSVYKYGSQYKNSFKNVLISSIAGFIIFLAWRLYIYLSIRGVYGTLDNINLGCVVRYTTSYVPVFCAIACAYIKKTLFNNEVNNLGKYQTFTLLIATISILYFLAGYVLQMPKLKAGNPELAFRLQAKHAYDLMSKGFKVDYDFSLDNSTTIGNKTFICYKLAYFLTPYYSNEVRDKCVMQPMPDRDYVSPIEKDKLNSNIEIDTILQNPAKYKCNIKYYPMYNHIDIECL